MTKNNRFSPAFEEGHFDGLVDDGEYLRQSSLYKQILPRTRCRLISLCPLWLFSLFICAFCAFLWLKNPFNQRNPRNPRLINDLRLRILTYEIINLFLQNEPNFRKSQMNISTFITKSYEQLTMNNELKNKPKTNPNEPKTNPIHRSVAPGQAGSKPVSKRRKITCFGISYPYNYWFRLNIGDFLCVSNAAVVQLTQKPPLKTR
jgi:hypothetical protein